MATSNTLRAPYPCWVGPVALERMTGIEPA